MVCYHRRLTITQWEAFKRDNVGYKVVDPCCKAIETAIGRVFNENDGNLVFRTLWTEVDNSRSHIQAGCNSF